MPQRSEKRVHPCECNGRPTTHTLYRIKNGEGKVWEFMFVCTNCGTHKPPPEEVDLAVANVDTATAVANVDTATAAADVDTATAA